MKSNLMGIPAAAGAACLLTGGYLYHMALDAKTDKSPLLKPSPDDIQPDNQALLRHRQALEESSRLTRQYQDRYLYSFDNLKLHAYLCMNGKSGNPKQTDTHIGTGSQTGTGNQTGIE